MKKKSASKSAFFNLRVLIGLCIALAGISLALLGLDAFAANTAPVKIRNHIITTSNDPLVPVGFDCTKIRQLGIDKQENFRAGAIMIACGAAEGGSGSSVGFFQRITQAVKKLLVPLYGAGDVNLITGTETSPNITQSETFTWANPDNPQQVVVAYNDSRGRNASPINISGASVSTDGGATFTRVTNASGQSPFAGTEGDPVVLYNRANSTWFTVWLDTACGGQGLGGYKSTNPSDPTSWTHFCVHNNSQDDRNSGWADNNPASPFANRMYISWNDFNVGGGALLVTYSSDNGTTWHAPIARRPCLHPRRPDHRRQDYRRCVHRRHERDGWRTRQPGQQNLSLDRRWQHLDQYLHRPHIPWPRPHRIRLFRHACTQPRLLATPGLG